MALIILVLVTGTGIEDITETGKKAFFSFAGIF